MSLSPDQQPATRKLRELLAAHQRMLVDLRQLAVKARHGISFHALSPYYDYRSGLDEYRALTAVLDAELGRIPSKLTPPYRERLSESERQMLALTIKAALEFFFQLSAIPILPVGIRECFMQELKSLHTAREQLHLPEHAGKLAPELEGDLEIAEEILEEIMLKAPSLMSFDTA